jgi:hypothetical protein
MCRTSRKSGALTYRIPQGPVQACSWTALLFFYSLKLMPKHSQFLYRTHFNTILPFSRQNGIWTMDSVELLLGPAARCYLLLPFRLVPVCLFRPATARTSRFATAGKCFVDLQQQEWVSFNQPIRIAIIRTQRRKYQKASFLLRTRKLFASVKFFNITAFKQVLHVENVQWLHQFR